MAFFFVTRYFTYRPFKMDEKPDGAVLLKDRVQFYVKQCLKEKKFDSTDMTDFAERLLNSYKKHAPGNPFNLGVFASNCLDNLIQGRKYHMSRATEASFKV